VKNRYSKIKRAWVRWTTWEYLPMWLSNLPVAGFYLWFALKARHPLFFSAANPAIPLGGAMGESKHDILQRLPEAVLPKMVLATPDMAFDDVLAAMQKTGLTFPLIAKPDVGERGFLVKKIRSAHELREHLSRYRVDFILQECILLPLEASVLFILFPGQKSRFEITSVCIKEFLHVTGDGKNSLRQLVLNNERAAFQLERLEMEYAEQMDEVLSEGQALPLGTIGNHCLGTKFLNGNHLIDKHLTQAFEGICRQIDGIHYGRFDLKCEDAEALKNGRIKVMELNGVLGEPAHVYDPSVGAWRAYRDFWRHWRLIFEVSQANRKQGVNVATLQEGRSQVRQYFAYKKQLA
jgi:hypothetical protein